MGKRIPQFYRDAEQAGKDVLDLWLQKNIFAMPKGKNINGERIECGSEKKVKEPYGTISANKSI